MDNQDWLTLWQTTATPAFHQTGPHPLLLKYWPQLPLPHNPICLIPLCGKSDDIFWLSQRCQHVYGVELSPIAIEAFFENYNLPYEKHPENNGFSAYSSNNITLLCGDIFKLTSACLPNVDIIYDRAALVALPSALRPSYCQLQQKFLNQKGQLLLLTMAFANKQDPAPPHSLANNEIQLLYKDLFSVRILHQRISLLTETDSLYHRGVRELTHYVFALTP